jgi:hypothetical protein
MVPGLDPVTTTKPRDSSGAAPEPIFGDWTEPIGHVYVADILDGFFADCGEVVPVALSITAPGRL